MYSKSPWTKGLTIVSIVATILIVAVIVQICYFAYTRADLSHFWILAALLAVAFLWGVVVAPKGVSVDEGGNVTIHLLACKIRIAKENIVKVTPFPSDRGTIRLIGSSGMFGYMGLFKNAEIGTFSSYATDFEKSFVIYRKSKRPIVVTVADPMIFDVLQ